MQMYSMFQQRNQQTRQEITNLPFPVITWVNDNMDKLKQILYQLREYLNKICEFPSIIKQFSQDLSDGLQYMCQKYGQVLEDLKEKTNKIQATINVYECVKEGENQKLLKDLEQKDEMIKLLEVKLSKSYKKTTFLNQVSFLKQRKNNENYKRSLVTPNQNFSRNEQSRIQQIKNRNIILRQKYFKYKQQDHSNKSKISNFSQSYFSTPGYYTSIHSRRGSLLNKTAQNSFLNSISQISQSRNKKYLMIEKNISKFRFTQNNSYFKPRKSKKQNIQNTLSTFLCNLRLK